VAGVTSVDSGVSSPLTLLCSVILSSGVACSWTPFWSMSMGSTIVESDVWMLDVLLSDTQMSVRKFFQVVGGRVWWEVVEEVVGVRKLICEVRVKSFKTD